MLLMLKGSNDQGNNRSVINRAESVDMTSLVKKKKEYSNNM